MSTRPTSLARYTRCVEAYRAPRRRRGPAAADEGLGSLPGDDPERDREETEAAIEAAGIDLDPAPPATTAMATRSTPTTTPTRTSTAEPGEPPTIGIVGAGPVGTALGVALTRAGWPIQAVASRDAARRERFAALWSRAPARSPSRRPSSRRSS